MSKITINFARFWKAKMLMIVSGSKARVIQSQEMNHNSENQ